MQLKVEEKEVTSKIDIRGVEVEIRPREWTFTLSDEEICDFVSFLLRRISPEQTASKSLSTLLGCPEEMYSILIDPVIKKTCPLLGLIIAERRRLGSVVV